mgnify:FL=1
MALYYWIGAIVVVAIIIFCVTSSPVVPVANTEVTPTVNDTSLEPASTLDTSGEVKPVSIAYADALVQFADRRIQFDKACQAFPNTVTYKDNTGIMIDNRASIAHTIKIGTTYTVKAYGFRIIVLPDIYLKSKALLVDCDKSQNVATVLVQG